MPRCSDDEPVVGKRLGKRWKHRRFFDDLMGAGGELAGILLFVLWRVNENEVPEAHVHHAPGRSADVPRGLCVHQYNADIVELLFHLQFI